MELKTTGVAGTLESSDVMVTLEPSDAGVTLDITSTVMGAYGRQIKETVIATLDRLGVKSAKVTVNDHGALDCTIKARVECAYYRGCQVDADGKFPWGGVIQ